MRLANAETDTDSSTEGLGALLRRTREGAGLRQIALAAAAHVGESTYRTWEHGRAGVPADALPLLAEALGVVFVADAGGWRVADAAPSGPVVLVAGSADAMREALDRLGVPGGE